MNRAKLKNRLRLLLDAHPATCLFVYKYVLGYHWRPTWTHFVEDSTELVIEGFQRSANSYAVRTFEAAQSHTVRIAHHAHLSSQIVYAVQLQKPVLLVIREPVATITSYVKVWPEAPIETVLEAYITYYERIIPHLCHCVIADFETVTHDFDFVVSELNARYQTRFEIPDGSRNTEVYAELTVGQGSFRHSTRPDMERKRITEEIRQAVAEARLSRAEACYAHCLEASVKKSC